jgi:predicted nucleic acid-binding protein
VASLVDTNILVYRCDPRDLAKREAARVVLREGQGAGDLRIPHQALVEFVSTVIRLRAGAPALMTRADATRQAELYMEQFPVLYPDEHVFRMALWGMGTYHLSWFDAHLWAYAERFSIPEILSEDFEHERRYGSVRIRNPFVAFGLA